MSYLKLSGGTIYDPVHNVDGAVGDIWIQNGKIVGAITRFDLLRAVQAASAAPWLQGLQ